MQNVTPMMKQYLEIKEKNKDSILFFRLGDFYEMFFEDAEIASKELEIVLTGKDCGLENRAPMCGIPFHSSENYVSRLIEKGYKVAICEQVEDPKEAKGIVKRDIVRIITPGTVIESAMLDEKKNNYLACIYVSKDRIGITNCDVSTGQMFVSSIENSNHNVIIDELSKYKPSEIICNEELLTHNSLVNKLKYEFSSLVSSFHQWAFEREYCIKRIKNHFNVVSMSAFGMDDNDEGVNSSGALLEYLYQTQKTSMDHIMTLRYINRNEYMILDSSTRRNLELTETLREKKRKGSLLWVIDKTNTSMGSRMIRNWLLQPLLDSDKINYRLNSVEELFNNISLREALKDNLSKIYDIERICSKVSYGTINPKDIISLKSSILELPNIKAALEATKTPYLQEVNKKLDTLKDVYQIIDNSIKDDPPFTTKDGGIIKDGYNNLVDEYRFASQNGKQWLAELEEKEKNLTGIKNLKIGYNKVFGYYIEITKSYYDLIPERYIRKQTLANCERLITQELKEIEEKLLSSNEKLIELEYNIFTEIREQIHKNLKRLQDSAVLLAELDSLYSLSQTAYENSYVKPVVDSSNTIKIVEGRHPVIEMVIPQNSFVPNDCLIDNDKEMIALITGPNMAGKSTYMRQVALITLMAQIGGFVPAKEASIGVVDRIFTRVGASDDLASGQSTFMVEMTEVANILNNSTAKSLLVLDEIGRGTSTFDGMSIAWAVIDYISKKICARTLFSTHYHELTSLKESIAGLNNYSIKVKEVGDDIIFLRKIINEAANSSFGIQVAKLAGLPEEVISHSRKILEMLEEKEHSETVRGIAAQNTFVLEAGDEFNSSKLEENKKVEKPIKQVKENDNFQLNIFDVDKINLVNAVKEIDIMALTPMDAMNKLYELCQMAKKI